jgi:5'-methylthioadenosine phosphorylase
MVIPDQFFDRTRARAEESTFFGAASSDTSRFRIRFARNSAILEESCKTIDGLKVHRGGTYLCMEGPAFSTKAESNVYRSWGMDIIGMTNLQEAKLAREAEIAYATLALVTDYDCWHEAHDSVSVEMVIEYLHKNVRNAQLVLKEAVKRVATKETPNPLRAQPKMRFSLRRNFGTPRRRKNWTRLSENTRRNSSLGKLFIVLKHLYNRYEKKFVNLSHFNFRFLNFR